MQFDLEPIYIDDISSILDVNGYISCVKFDKEVIIIQFYDRDPYTLRLHRRDNELISVSSSCVGNNKCNVFLSVSDMERIPYFKTSIKSCKLMIEYYNSYNTYLSKYIINQKTNHELTTELNQAESVDLNDEEMWLMSRTIESLNRSFAQEQKINKIALKIMQQQIQSMSLNHNEVEESPIHNNNNYVIADIDRMSGYDFESYISELFVKKGYRVMQTSLSKDQGIDVIVNNEFIKIGIQTKRYNNKVGNSAIQEAVAGRAFYNCDKVIVITNNYFTTSAIELAKSNNVGMMDRDNLINFIQS